jgi:seryl-tRNA synthetase
MQNKETQKVIDRFSDNIRDIVLEYDEKEKMLSKEVNSLKSRNAHLLKKLEIKFDFDEMNNNELYLVERIERLEEELKQTEEFCKSLQAKITVDNS